LRPLGFKSQHRRRTFLFLFAKERETFTKEKENVTLSFWGCSKHNKCFGTQALHASRETPFLSGKKKGFKENKMPDKDKKEVKENPKGREAREVKTKEDDLRHRVRVAGVILDGDQDLTQALTHIKGVGLRTSKVVAYKLGFPKGTKLGSLQEKDIEKIEETLSSIHKIAPPWMCNRQRDYYSGENVHLIGPDLEMSQREDIAKHKRIKSYRGVRHSLGLPVRGQRTRSTSRKGTTVGVVRKKTIATPPKTKTEK